MNRMASEKIAPPLRRPPATSRLAGTVPLVLETTADDHYALVDSGNGLKLERYGALTIIRPEGQALWQPALDEAAWRRADAVFTGDTEEDGIGRWRFPKVPLGETWPLQWEGLSYLGRFTSFRHVGVFPEQAAHWRFIEAGIGAAVKAGRQPRLLNLFGYTGLACLVAARAGAHVTHVDASKKAIGWARENQELARLEEKPIRWMCDDAVKFCERELRRGNRLRCIICSTRRNTGAGRRARSGNCSRHLPHMMDILRELVSDKPLFVVADGLFDPRLLLCACTS